MASRRPPSRNRSRAFTEMTLGIVIPFVIIGLSIADFVRDGQIDKYLIGTLLVFGLGALGYRVDNLIERYIDARAGISPKQRDEEDDEGSRP